MRLSVAAILWPGETVKSAGMVRVAQAELVARIPRNMSAQRDIRSLLKSSLWRPRTLAQGGNNVALKTQRRVLRLLLLEHPGMPLAIQLVPVPPGLVIHFSLGLLRLLIRSLRLLGGL